MSTDFTTKQSKPSAKEYLDATESQLIERMNNNPGNLDSEFPFIKAVLDVKASESICRTNRHLVIVTWVLCIATILAAIVSAYLVTRWETSQQTPNNRLETTGDPLRGSPSPQP